MRFRAKKDGVLHTRNASGVVVVQYIDAGTEFDFDPPPNTKPGLWMEPVKTEEKSAKAEVPTKK